MQSPRVCFGNEDVGPVTRTKGPQPNRISLETYHTLLWLCGWLKSSLDDFFGNGLGRTWIIFGIWIERELANQPFNLGAWIGKVFISGDLGFKLLQPRLHLCHFP
jgi:hypothetical protein